MSEVDRSGWVRYTREQLGLPVIAQGPKPRPILCRITDRGCWICVSHCRRQEFGYPVISIAGEDQWIGKLLYEREAGPVPEGLVLRHECDDPMCVNPVHLKPGTHAENSQDMRERGRSMRGSRNGHARLTEEQVREIKASNGISSREWGERLGVRKTAILQIWRGQTWSHVEGAGLHHGRRGNCKLTEAQVREIRQQREVPLRILAERYGVTPQAICLVRSGRNWKQIREEP